VRQVITAVLKIPLSCTWRSVVWCISTDVFWGTFTVEDRRQHVPPKRPHQTTCCHIPRNNNPKNGPCLCFSALKDLIQGSNLGACGRKWKYFKWISAFCPQVQTCKLWDQFRLKWVSLTYGKSCPELLNFTSLFTVMSPLMHDLQIPVQKLLYSAWNRI
jgi:hypothetical protein